MQSLNNCLITPIINMNCITTIYFKIERQIILSKNRSNLSTQNFCSANSWSIITFCPRNQFLNIGSSEKPAISISTIRKWRPSVNQTLNWAPTNRTRLHLNTAFKQFQQNLPSGQRLSAKIFRLTLNFFTKLRKITLQLLNLWVELLPLVISSSLNSVIDYSLTLDNGQEFLYLFTRRRRRFPSKFLLSVIALLFTLSRTRILLNCHQLPNSCRKLRICRDFIRNLIVIIQWPTITLE